MESSIEKLRTELKRRVGRAYKTAQETTQRREGFPGIATAKDIAEYSMMIHEMVNVNALSLCQAEEFLDHENAHAAEANRIHGDTIKKQYYGLEIIKVNQRYQVIPFHYCQLKEGIKETPNQTRRILLAPRKPSRGDLEKIAALNT